MLPRDPKKREAALADAPKLDLPKRRIYPEPGTDRPETLQQGPNEQSIVASGMTVEEWQRKHPRQRLGPEPEEVGQMVTDPVDGSDPEPSPIYPGTFSSVDPDGTKTRAENENPLFPLEGEPPVPDQGLPGNPDDPRPDNSLPEPEPDQGLPPNPDQQPVPEGEQEIEGEVDAPWSSMNRHADLDEFVRTEEFELPKDWDTKTVAQKKAWLDEESQDV